MPFGIPIRLVMPAGLVRPVPVVMTGVFAEDRPKAPFVVDQHPAGAPGPRGSHPPLGIAIRARGPRRSLYYLRSEEHTSELQSLRHLVCRLLLEKKHHTGLIVGGLIVAGGSRYIEAGGARG